MSSHLAHALFLGQIIAGFVLATAVAGIVMAHALLSPAWLPAILG
jgi:hypothetical protein